VSVELMIESCLKGFGTAFEGVGARRHEAQSVLASVCFADADSQIWLAASGRYEPLDQVDRLTADLKTAVAESFDDSSLRVSRRSTRSTGRLKPATSGHPMTKIIGQPPTGL